MSILPQPDKFEFTTKERNYGLITIAIGVVMLIIGLLTNLDNPTRIYTALLFNNYFFLMLGVCALFFICAHTVGWGGWYLMLRRVSEAITMYIPIGAVLLIITLALGMKEIYIWSHEELTDPANAHFDKLLAAKKWWLNNSGWWIRSILYLFLWTGFAFLIRRNSLASDQSSNLNYYNKSVTISAFFIFVFAITSSTAPWDWFMSIQPHWFSTLWGWYSFISMFVASCAVTMLFVIYLRGKGYLKNVTDEHQHDLGVFMFAFSVAWGYLFFSQFMLIWYSNMPEETSYYKLRIDHYTLLMWACVFMNFITPFLVLMTAGAKRHRKVAAFGAIVIIIGHWLDFFQMSMPAAINEMSHYHSMHAADGAAHHEPHFNHPGFLEIGLGLTLAGIFMLVVFNALSKASLVPKNHPFTKESVIHHV